jgi:hypothetical protein
MTRERHAVQDANFGQVKGISEEEMFSVIKTGAKTKKKVGFDCLGCM